MFKTDLEKFLNEQAVANFVSVATFKTAKEYYALSDFERFALICESSDALLYSSVLNRFVSLLSELNEGKITLDTLKNRFEQNRLWRRIHGGESCKYEVNTEPQNVCVDYYKLYIENETFDIIGYTSLRGNELPDTLEEFIKNLNHLSSKPFLVDLSDFEFVRPNEYLVNKIYQKIKRGEKYKKSEIGALVSHIVCSIGKKQKARICIVIQNDISVIWDLLELFEKRRSSVEISIRFNPVSCKISEKIFDLMLQSGKKISSEIIIPEDEDISNIQKCLTDLLCKIPFSRIAWQKDYAAYINKL